MPGALNDIKVLDFTRMYAGPFATSLLADLGAKVIKVEIPGGGDPVRDLPPQTDGGESYIFVNLNRSKESITINLSSEKGKQICRELVKEVDIVAENFTPGVMDRLGLGYEDIKKINPQVIYASLSGYGHTGLHCSLPSFDTLAQATGGFMSVTGFPDGLPVKSGPAVADFTGSFYVVISVLAALHHRSMAGEGQHIDISLQDGMWALTAIQFSPTYFLTGEAPQRLGNRQIEATPFGVYTAKDGYVAIAIVTVGQWQNFLKTIGKEDLLSVQKYAVQKERIKYWKEIDALVEEWTQTRTVEEVVEILNSAHLPCSSVLTVDKVANDPHLLSREMIIEVEQLVSGKLKVPGSVFKLSKTPGNASLPAPFLGQDNYKIFSNLLGYSEAKIRHLTDEGVI